MADKFSLADILGGRVSDSDTGGREQIEYIDLGLIDSDENNFYTLSDVEGLASNIALLGLQQPLRVRTHPEDKSRVVIVSGHRRRAAIEQLVGEGREDLRQVPCIRERGDGSAAMQELRLIYANSDTRRMTASEISRQAERVELLLYQLKEEGVEFPGRMRDHVAQACKVSASKLARLKVIREGLCGDFAEAFEAGKLPEQTAYALARLPEDFQQRIFRVSSVKALNGSYMERVAQMYLDGRRWEPQLTCPDGKACTHGDAALRHDLDSYDPCGGEKCCLTCHQATRGWSPCERMCSKAKAVKKKKAAEDKEKEEKAKQKTISGYQKKTQANALRLVKAIDAAGLKDTDKIEWGYGETPPVSMIRKYAAGDFEDTGYWYDAKFEARRLQDPVKTARKLKCTTDFLFGLTEDPNPVVAAQAPAEAGVSLRWIPGARPPDRPMEVVARFDLGGGLLHRIFARWSGTEWTFKNGERVDSPVVDWYPLPDEEENK